MISVAEALDALFALVTPLDTEDVALGEADNRVLHDAALATRNQPPFSASAMDGYAVARNTVAIGDSFEVIGEAAAGHSSDLALSDTEAIRIFTGAPIPEGTTKVIIQEDVTREGDTITISADPGDKDNIRPAGGDFKSGDSLSAPRRLTPADLALLAAMNVGRLTVTRKPVVALLATGDELVMPGEDPGPDQIIASNIFGLKAMLERAGAEARLLPIARDNMNSLKHAFSLAAGADLLVTIGGASVGDRDLVGQAAADEGLERAFYKVAMRPGKPLMAGQLQNTAMIGLPGNPVSAMVCGEVFLRPVIDAMLGLPVAARPRQSLPLAHDMPANGPREHYMRATIIDGAVHVTDRQDSSLLSVLASADVLAIRPPNAAGANIGERIEVIRL